MDFRASSMWASYLRAVGWTAIKLRDGGYAYMYRLPVGSVMRIIPGPYPDYAEIKHVEQKHHVLFTRVEFNTPPRPHVLAMLKKAGFERDPWSSNTSETYMVDLTKSEKYLMAHMNRNWRRYLKKMNEFPVQLRENDDIDSQISIWQENARRKGRLAESPFEAKILWSVLKKYHRTSICVASCNNTAVASAWMIFWKEQAFLWHLGYTGAYPQYQVPRLLVWHTIQSCKKRGYRVFNMGSGSSQFKKGAGALIVPLPGYFIHFTHPLAAPFLRFALYLQPGIVRLMYRRFSQFRYGNAT